MIDFIPLFFCVVAHNYGDVAFQKPEIAHNKAKHWYLMLTHVMCWTGAIALVLFYFGLFEWWKIAVLIGGHFVIDSWKSRVPKTPENWNMIYVDQGLHMIQLLVVFLL